MIGGEGIDFDGDYVIVHDWPGALPFDGFFACDWQGDKFVMPVNSEAALPVIGQEGSACDWSVGRCLPRMRGTTLGLRQTTSGIDPRERQ
jgi:hypothetical protein